MTQKVPETINYIEEIGDLTVFELFLHKRNFSLTAHSDTINEDYPYRFWEKGRDSGNMLIVIGINDNRDGIEITYPGNGPEDAELPLAESECLGRLESLFPSRDRQVKERTRHPFREALEKLV
jgi:hypothetical protein